MARLRRKNNLSELYGVLTDLGRIIMTGVISIVEVGYFRINLTELVTKLTGSCTKHSEKIMS